MYVYFGCGKVSVSCVIVKYNLYSYKDKNNILLNTISDKPCTAFPLYNSTGRLNILRMLSSLFVSKHAPSGDLRKEHKNEYQAHNKLGRHM